MMSDAAATRSNFYPYRSMKSVFGHASFFYIFSDSAYSHHMDLDRCPSLSPAPEACDASAYA
jgi:hypothetical protein